MNSISKFLSLVDAFCVATERAEATVSTLVFNDGAKIKLLRSGRNIGVLTLDRAVQWFSDHWPEGAEWPESLPRPAKSVSTEGDAA